MSFIQELKGNWTKVHSMQVSLPQCGRNGTGFPQAKPHQNTSHTTGWAVPQTTSHLSLPCYPKDPAMRDLFRLRADNFTQTSHSHEMPSVIVISVTGQTWSSIGTTYILYKLHIFKCCISLEVEEHGVKKQLVWVSSARSFLPGKNKEHLSIPMPQFSSTPSHFPSLRNSLYVNVKIWCPSKER